MSARMRLVTGIRLPCPASFRNSSSDGVIIYAAGGIIAMATTTSPERIRGENHYCDCVGDNSHPDARGHQQGIFAGGAEPDHCRADDEGEKRVPSEAEQVERDGSFRQASDVPAAVPFFAHRTHEPGGLKIARCH